MLFAMRDSIVHIPVIHGFLVLSMRINANRSELTLVLLCPDIYGVKDVLDQ